MSCQNCGKSEYKEYKIPGQSCSLVRYCKRIDWLEEFFKVNKDYHYHDLCNKCYCNISRPEKIDKNLNPDVKKLANPLRNQNKRQIKK